MAYIKITFKDGAVKEFNQQGCSGGSWTNTVEYQPGWVVVTDLYKAKYAYPIDIVQEVIEIPGR